jgi:hypothetical protein
MTLHGMMSVIILGVSMLTVAAPSSQPLFIAMIAKMFFVIVFSILKR